MTKEKFEKEVRSIQNMDRVKIICTHSNGDIEYKVLKGDIFLEKGIIWLLGLLLAFPCCYYIQKWIISPYLRPLLGVLALCSIILLVVLYRYSKLLWEKEESLVINAVRTIVEQDLVREDLKAVKVKFYSDTLDSYGTIDEEYVLVLLSGGTIIKYSIEQLDIRDKSYNYKLIKREYSKQIKITQKQRLLRPGVWSRIMNSPLFSSLLVWSIILMILAAGGAVAFFLFKYIHTEYDFISLLSIPLAGMLFTLMYGYLDRILPKNKRGNAVRKILYLPIVGLLIINSLAMPFFTILGAILLITAVAFLPIFFFVTGVESFGYCITPNAKLYIFLTCPFVIASQGSRLLCRIILKYTFFREDNHHFQVLMRELVKFLYTKENLNFITYAGYFCFLAVSSFKLFQTGGALLSQDLDLIVTKSFLVYMACTSMLDRKKASNIEPKALLKLLIKLLLARDDKTWTREECGDKVQG